MRQVRGKEPIGVGLHLLKETLKTLYGLQKCNSSRKRITVAYIPYLRMPDPSVDRAGTDSEAV